MSKSYINYSMSNKLDSFYGEIRSTEININNNMGDKFDTFCNESDSVKIEYRRVS